MLFFFFFFFFFVVVFVFLFFFLALSYLDIVVGEEAVGLEELERLGHNVVFGLFRRCCATSEIKWTNEL